MSRASDRPDEARDQTSDRFNENPAVGTCSIRGTYDALGGRFENDTHDQYPQYPRVMAGAVAKFPSRG